MDDFLVMRIVRFGNGLAVKRDSSPKRLRMTRIKKTVRKAMGFTLIELLVVIAIIAVLAAMLLPPLEIPLWIIQPQPTIHAGKG